MSADSSSSHLHGISRNLITTIRESLQTASRLYREQKYDEALRYYDETIEQNPTIAVFYKRRGKCHMMLKNWDAAISDFKKVAELVPENTKCRYRIVKSLYSSGKYKEAVDEMLLLDNLKHIALLGQKLSLDQKYDEAIRCYDVVINKSERPDPFHYKRRGDCYFELNNLWKALENYKRALTMEPFDGLDIWYRVIEILFDTGAAEEAKNMMRTLNELQLVSLGNRLREKGKLAPAILCSTEAILRNPSESWHYFYRGECLWRRGILPIAVSELQRAVEIEPDNDNYRISLNVLLFDAERRSEAVQAMVELNDAQLISLGKRLFDEGKFEEAVLCYSEAIRRNPENAEHYNKRGHCHLKRKNLEEAISDFEKSIQDPSCDPSYRIDLVETLLEVEKHGEAKSILDNIIGEGELEVPVYNRLLTVRNKLEEMEAGIVGNYVEL